MKPEPYTRVMGGPGHIVTLRLPRQMVRVVRVSESSVLYDYSRKNNHRCTQILSKKLEVQAEEYRVIREQTDYEQWRALRPTKGEVVVSLDRACVQTLARAGHIGIHTFKLPDLYEEELNQVIGQIQTQLLATSASFFVRLSSCSTKGGNGGVGPFWDSKQIVKALVTSYRCVDVFDRVEDCKLYVSPFRTYFHPDEEFRVFICNNCVTCISQYNEKECCGWGELHNDTLLLICNNIVNLHTDLLQKALACSVHLHKSFTFDVFCHKGHNFDVELIEFNTFGAQMAAGSCLFDWIKDYDTMHSATDGIEMRVVSASADSRHQPQ